MFNGGWENYFTNPLQLESLVTTNQDAVQQSIELTQQYNHQDRQPKAEELYEEELERRRQEEAARQAALGDWQDYVEEAPTIVGAFFGQLGSTLKRHGWFVIQPFVNFIDLGGMAGETISTYMGGEFRYQAIGEMGKAAENGVTTGELASGIGSGLVQLGTDVVTLGSYATYQYNTGQITTEEYSDRLVAFGSAIAGGAKSIKARVGGMSGRAAAAQQAPMRAPKAAPRAGGAVSGGCFVPGTPVRLCAELAVADSSLEATATPTDATTQSTTTAIENVALGKRVPDQNPRAIDYDFSLRDVDQETWRQVDVRLRRMDGAVVEMQLLRPDEWVENLNLSVGSEFKLILSEFEVDGNAVVTSIGPCCEIDEGEGNVVTGRFVTRQVSNLVEVTLENETTFTGTTTHPVWIPEKQDWVELGDLQEGQRLATLTDSVTVTKVRRPTRVSDVFNIEVHGHHVYRITDDGVLVHNNSSVGGRFFQGDHIFNKGLRKGFNEAAEKLNDVFPELAAALRKNADELAAQGSPFSRTVQKAIDGVDANSQIFGRSLAAFRRQLDEFIDAVWKDGLDAAKAKHGDALLSSIRKLMDDAFDADAAALLGKDAAGVAGQGRQALLLMLKQLHDLF